MWLPWLLSDPLLLHGAIWWVYNLTATLVSTYISRVGDYILKHRVVWSTTKLMQCVPVAWTVNHAVRAAMSRIRPRKLCIFWLFSFLLFFGFYYCLHHTYYSYSHFLFCVWPSVPRDWIAPPECYSINNDGSALFSAYHHLGFVLYIGDQWLFSTNDHRPYYDYWQQKWNWQRSLEKQKLVWF